MARTKSAAASDARATFRSPFSPLELSTEDETQLEGVAHMLVQHTIAQYQRFQLHDKRTVDTDAWKLMKRQGDLCVYAARRDRDIDKRMRRRERRNSRDRRSHDVTDNNHEHRLSDRMSRHSLYRSESTTSSSQYQESESTSARSWSPTSGVSARTTSVVYSHQHNHTSASMDAASLPSREQAATHNRDLPVVLAVGTLDGSLQDTMLGAVNPTADAMRVKSAFVHDGVVDCAVLATLIAPTPDEPFQSLSVKWFQTGPQSAAAAAARSLLRPFSKLTTAATATSTASTLPSTSYHTQHDVVVLEATGITQLPSGERVGYILAHTVHFPQTTQPLAGVMRSNVSLCCLVRRSSKTTVDVFVKAHMNPLGNSSSSSGVSDSFARSLATKAAVRSVLSLPLHIAFGRTKKLAFALEQQHQCGLEQIHDSSYSHCRSSSSTVLLAESSSVCAVVESSSSSSSMSTTPACCVNCKKRAKVHHGGHSRRFFFHRRRGAASARSMCKLCFQYVCASCSVKKTLRYVAAAADGHCVDHSDKNDASGSGALRQREVTLCALCVHVAMVQTDASMVASEQAAALRPTVSPMPLLLLSKRPFAAASVAFSDNSLFDHTVPW